ncbi:hypothetical protein J2W14_003030 [Pseudarthrobacter oxydans]|uniref:hypothetical protein n=1 Tax=Pseudarthrobacter oxydans TaxID=1671 RepID=UPI00277EDF84|nr:hypothetical protein [Pseudarthrobacter oxydans]MDP9983609.1 hypothetical protein [Pseudarthrobacter oxydans]
MARFNAQPLRGARSFLDLRELRAVPQDFGAEWAAEKRPRGLLKPALDIRSNYEFVARLEANMAAWLTGEGIDGALSAAVLPEVLRDPGFSASRNDDGLTHIRHAVVMHRNDGAGPPFEILVRADVWVKARHVPAGANQVIPAEVVREELLCTIVDMEDDAEIGDLMRAYLDMVAEFGPLKSARTLTRLIVFLGDPRALGSQNAPENWRNELKELCRAFDADVQFHRGPKFTDTASDKVTHVVRFEPYSGEEPRTTRGGEIEHTKIDARSIDYSDIFDQIALALVNIEDEAESSAFEPRALEPGEQVFHRKRGRSGKFDLFDEGADTACSHRVGFVRFHNSDKAIKGFRRRYTNFEDSWMRHCSKYPDCGMYAVFCPDRNEASMD